MANGILAAQPAAQIKVKKCGVTQSPTTGLGCHGLSYRRERLSSPSLALPDPWIRSRR